MRFFCISGVGGFLAPVGYGSGLFGGGGSRAGVGGVFSRAAQGRRLLRVQILADLGTKFGGFGGMDQLVDRCC